MRLGPFAICVLTLSLLASALVVPSAAATSRHAGGAATFERAAVPAKTKIKKGIHVTPKYDTKAAVSAVIDPTNGGTLTTRGPRGITYTLTVPSEALLSPADVTMTPLESVKGLPKHGKLVAGVKLEPDGLLFDAPAALRIHFPHKQSAKTIRSEMPALYEGSGRDLEGAQPFPDSTNDGVDSGGSSHDEVLQVDHFTGELLSNRIATMTPAGTTLQQKYDAFNNKISKLLQDAHADAVAHPDNPGDSHVLDQVSKDLEKAFDDVAKAQLETVLHDSDASLGDMTRAIAFGLGLLRAMQLAGDESQRSANDQAYLTDKMKILVQRYIDKASKACVANGFPSGYARRLLGMVRQGELLGFEGQGSANWQKALKCLKQTYTVTATGSGTVSARGQHCIVIPVNDVTEFSQWSIAGNIHVTTGEYNGGGDFTGQGSVTLTSGSVTPCPDSTVKSAQWVGQDPEDNGAQAIVLPDYSNVKRADKRVWINVSCGDESDIDEGGGEDIVAGLLNLQLPKTPRWVSVPINGSAKAPIIQPTVSYADYTLSGPGFTYSVTQN